MNRALRFPGWVVPLVLLAGCSSSESPSTQPTPPTERCCGIHVTVTRVVAVDTAPANSSSPGLIEDFELHNLDNFAGSVTLICSAANSITCNGFPDGNPAGLAANATVNYALRFKTGAANANGVIRMSTSGGGLDSTRIVVQ